MTDEYRIVAVHDSEDPYDPERLRKINEHPCYSEKAYHVFGRCHLPVAPKCNIQCNYCIRDFDCVNENRPGVTSQVLNPEEAFNLARRVVRDYPYVKVTAVAGPGDPLANPETFETLRLVHEEFPDQIMCISTNGLMLPEYIEELAKYDVGNITVTLNAVDPAIGEKIYSWVDYKGKRYHGREAAEILLSQQLRGIEMAVARDVFVKINTVYIPGINDEHIPEIARIGGEMGVFTHNIIPVIPQYKFADITPPTPEDKQEMQDRCAPYLRQMRHCVRCRADAIGKLGQDVQSSIFQQMRDEKKE
ncbi:nitrogenase cofactor biosynthesis protein NifB [Methanoculleus sp. MH98A]|jgi:nitrogen fixation protein NifB|uniref:nitrogenase cofactor biosynthesis protein NifB n=1 Tax=Methanoculleus sp. MH98A TaxID=1495314 RepID=UPI00049FBA53|nr:nitrogenase cofactor biosynthesis protein NifB [Methanoculleus sp. MH98A]KDE55472.1 nitrogenase molybdenum-iron cofactor biosynthesis protein [Methanoculleus sp. MH98A]MCK9308394.1 nitrogenase cofactor biosynthesis protein NifB [Methanoculleus sp.]